MNPVRLTRVALLIGMAFLLAAGCRSAREPASPADAGLNTRDLIDPETQAEANDLAQPADFESMSDQLRGAVRDIVARHGPEALSRPPRDVLCLSGGGSYGAFSVGVLYGWTETGRRPCFDVVTGISTGALVAPLAFLGPAYDETLREFYTTLEQEDIYRARPVRGLVSEGLADTAPLARQIDRVLTPRLVAEIAREHAKGRRLYIGTTELEGRRLVIWDVGRIATRGDRCLIKKVLLGSSAIPGFFPPAHIRVTVDGRQFEELHGDGSVSASLFFRPPWVPPASRSELTAANLFGTRVWCVVAGKLYGDPESFRARALAIATNSISTLLYSQTLGDLQRLFNLCLLNGMEFRLTSIPLGYPAPESSTDFEPSQMRAMFEEGRRLVRSGIAWRDTPPGFEDGEADLQRGGTALTHSQRGPAAASGGGSTPPLTAPGQLPIPVIPGEIER